ncbi:Pyruvate decarboxylase 2 [Mactra antiquata]
MAIETKSEFSINVLDALRFLQQAWECVTPVTITNCFSHAGFTAAASLPNEEEDDDSLDNIPLARLASLGDNVVLSAYVNFAETIQTSSTLSDEDIISDVLDAQDHEHPEDDEVIVPSSIKNPNVDDALTALDTMRDFFEGQKDSDQELSMLCKLSRKLLRSKVDALGNKRQSSILEFTSEWTSEFNENNRGDK